VKAATVTFDKEDCRILKLLSKATGITAFNLTVQLQGKQIAMPKCFLSKLLEICIV
jgi:hypothetical protein